MPQGPVGPVTLSEDEDLVIILLFRRVSSIFTYWLRESPCTICAGVRMGALSLLVPGSKSESRRQLSAACRAVSELAMAAQRLGHTPGTQGHAGSGPFRPKLLGPDRERSPWPPLSRLHAEAGVGTGPRRTPRWSVGRLVVTSTSRSSLLILYKKCAQNTSAQTTLSRLQPDCALTFCFLRRHSLQATGNRALGPLSRSVAGPGGEGEPGEAERLWDCRRCGWTSCLSCISAQRQRWPACTRRAEAAPHHPG